MTEWRDVPGWAGLYEVSDDGRVYSLRAGRMLRPTSRNGYQMVQLWRSNKAKAVYIHRLVAMAFVDGYAEGLDVRHLDGSRDNNTVANLAWGTRQQNVDDAVAHGTALHKAKLNELEVRAIRAIIANKINYRKPTRAQIAAAFGITTGTVTDIGSGRTWAHVVD